MSRANSRSALGELGGFFKRPARASLPTDPKPSFRPFWMASGGSPNYATICPLHVLQKSATPFQEQETLAHQPQHFTSGLVWSQVPSVAAEEAADEPPSSSLAALVRDKKRKFRMMAAIAKVFKN